MEYKGNKSIYLQIADHICEKILKGVWRETERIPSIREMSVEAEVNPNTMTRTYNYLQENGIVYNERGIGYFVSQNAISKTQSMMKSEFFKEEVPHFFKQMELLDISFDELQTYYSTRKEKNHEKE
jgi:DNA-binding transcriptional regulator YhcF (GntR family)